LQIEKRTCLEIELQVKYYNGASYSKEYIYSKGYSKNPFTDQELAERFRECSTYSAYKLTDAAIESLIDNLMNLEKVDDVVNALLLPLIPK
jgi:hypothetical protein